MAKPREPISYEQHLVDRAIKEGPANSFHWLRKPKRKGPKEGKKRESHLNPRRPGQLVVHPNKDNQHNHSLRKEIFDFNNMEISPFVPQKAHLDAKSAAHTLSCQQRERAKMRL